MINNYMQYADRFSELTEEELHYKKLYEMKYLPSVPDYIKDPKDLQHRDDAYIPDGDIKIRKHPCFLPNYIHEHSFLEIPMVLRGSCQQRFYGETFSMKEGDALIIVPGTYHSIAVYDKNTIVVNLLICMSMLPPLLEFIEPSSDIMKLFIEALKDKTASRTCMYIKGAGEAFNILPELDDRSYYPLFRIKLAEFFVRLFRSNTYSFPVMPTEKNNRLTCILERIRQDPAEVSLTMLADEFGLSPGYLSMMIHAETGLKFSSLVAKRKIQIAQQLLLSEREVSNMEIAEKIGMNPQQFCRFFRKWLGMTPQDYRRTKYGMQ